MRKKENWNLNAFQKRVIFINHRVTKKKKIVPKVIFIVLDDQIKNKSHYELNVPIRVSTAQIDWDSQSRISISILIDAKLLSKLLLIALSDCGCLVLWCSHIMPYVRKKMKIFAPTKKLKIALHHTEKNAKINDDKS